MELQKLPQQTTDSRHAKMYPNKTNKERAELVRCVTAQRLFVVQHSRPDLRTVIFFLTKHFREETADEDETKKLTRVAKYIRRTKFLCLNQGYVSEP